MRMILPAGPLAALFLLAADEPTREQQALARDLDGNAVAVAARAVSKELGRAYPELNDLAEALARLGAPKEVHVCNHDWQVCHAVDICRICGAVHT